MLYIIVALLVFGLIVMVHEFGHFIMAKKCGIGVIEFSIGMGPRIFSIVKGETRYSIKIIPFGGSCMMVGEDENSTDETAFGKKSVWARMAVIFAGPLFNFILAFVFAVIIILYAGYDSPQIEGVVDGYPAQEAGLQAGDTITKINNKKIYIYRDVQLYVSFHQGETLNIQYKRAGTDGESLAVIVPRYSEDDGVYLMGIYAGKRIKSPSFLRTLGYGLYEVKYWIETVVKSLGMLITGKAGINDLSGPGRIMYMIGETVEENIPLGLAAVLLNLANMCVLLSANLGVMNLLPLPALDGGRLVFLIIEAFRGKPIDPEKEGMVHFAGMVLLMALMIFVLFNDIRSFF